MLSSSFWPSICAFTGVLFAAIAIIDFVAYVAARYRERYLQEARTELDPSSKATLWVKAQHEGALPPPCIVRKDPRVPHTARRGA